MPGLYRKKPVVIEAMCWADVARPDDIIEWVRSEAGPGIATVVWGGMGWDFKIKTLEGYMQVSPGDYVIRGVQGEFYPCKPDIFEQTYEAVDGTD